jgi:phosphoglycolate phosphatase
MHIEINSPKGVIFDLDGTLVDSLESIASAMNKVLTDRDLPTHSQKTYRFFVGDGLEKLVRRSLPVEYGRKADISALIKAYRNEYEKIWREKTPLYPGIPDLLNFLLTHRIAMTILTNKSEDSAQKIVLKLLGNWPFVRVYGAKPGIPLKPDPSAALEICQSLKIPAAQMVFVGDTAVDMETGNAAGMITVGALWGFREERELVSAGARLVIQQPIELRTLFPDTRH